MVPDIKIVLINDSTLLGALIYPRHLAKAIIEKHDDLIRMAGRLEQIDARETFLLLKNCFALPKLPYIVRASPTYLNGAQLRAFDRTVCETISKISGVDSGLWSLVKSLVSSIILLGCKLCFQLSREVWASGGLFISLSLASSPHCWQSVP